MTVDRYTKAVLTVIAGCLLWICAMGSAARVDAQQTTMPLAGTVQPVVIVGTGSMDRLGHIVVNFTGARTDPSVPVQLPYSVTRPLPVSLPYTVSSPMPSQLFYTTLGGNTPQWLVNETAAQRFWPGRSPLFTC